MGNAKPTLGYRSRTEAAAALRAEGLTNAAIAIRLGISQNAVSGLLSESKRERRRTEPTDTERAAADGILLAQQAGQVIHRCTEPPVTRVVEVHLSEREFAALVQMAREDARTPASTARLCIQASLALRGIAVREGR